MYNVSSISSLSECLPKSVLPWACLCLPLPPFNFKFKGNWFFACVCHLMFKNTNLIGATLFHYSVISSKSGMMSYPSIENCVMTRSRVSHGRRQPTSRVNLCQGREQDKGRFGWVYHSFLIDKKVLILNKEFRIPYFAL